MISMILKKFVENRASSSKIIFKKEEKEALSLRVVRVKIGVMMNMMHPMVDFKGGHS